MLAPVLFSLTPQRTLSFFIQESPLMASHTKQSFTSSASCHHAIRISCKITESWKLQSVVSPPLANIATIVPQALCNIEFLAHVTFTCIGSTFSYPHKELLIPTPPRTSTHTSVGTRNPRGLPRPVQDSNVYRDQRSDFRF